MARKDGTERRKCGRSGDLQLALGWRRSKECTVKEGAGNVTGIGVVADGVGNRELGRG